MTYMLPVLAVVSYFVLKGTIVVPEFTWKKIAIVVAFLVIGQTTWHILATKQWDGFCRVFRNELVKYNGAVPYEDTILKNHWVGKQLIAVINWSWETPTMSILLAKDAGCQNHYSEPCNRTLATF